MKIDLLLISLQAAVIAFAWVHVITDADGIGGVIDKWAAEKLPRLAYKAFVGCAPCNSFYWFTIICLSRFNHLAMCVIDLFFYICLALTIAKFLQNYKRF